MTAISHRSNFATSALTAPTGTASAESKSIRLSARKSARTCFDPFLSFILRRIHRIAIYFHWIFDHTNALLPTVKNGTVTQTEYEMLAALRYSLRQFLRFSEEAAQGLGLTPQQHQALLAIKGFPGRDRINIGELAERLQLRHHSAVGLAGRLVRKKLVQRKRDATDHRQAYLTLTRRGQSLLEQLSAAHKEQLRRIGPEIESVLQRLRG